MKKSDESKAIDIEQSAESYLVDGKIVHVTYGEDEEVFLNEHENILLNVQLSNGGKISGEVDVENRVVTLNEPLPEIVGFDLKTFVDPKRMSPYAKGKLGEALVEIVTTIELNELVELTVDGSPHDMHYGEQVRRIDAKYSPPHQDELGPKYWKFHLSTNSKGNLYQEVSKTKGKKDYGESCDILVLVGQYDDGRVEFFLFSSSDPVVRDLKHNIKIPVDFSNSKYKSYKMDLTKRVEVDDKP